MAQGHYFLPHGREVDFLRGKHTKIGQNPLFLAHSVK